MDIKIDRRTPILWIIILTLIIVGAMLYSSYAGRSIAERYAPLMDAAMEIKLETTTAHLWLEEVISGDRSIDIAVVWEHLDQAEWYTRAMLEGGENQEGKFVPLKDPVLRHKIEQTLEGVNAFRAIAQERWASQSQSGIGSDIDQRFDRTFDTFLILADDTETILQQTVKRQLQRFYFVQSLLIVIVVVAGILIAFVFNRHDRRRLGDMLALKQREDELKKSGLDLARAEQIAHLGSWEFDLVNNELIWSDEVYRIFEIDPGKSGASYKAFVDAIHPDDREFVTQAYTNAVQNRTPYNSEHRLLMEDGRVKYINELCETSFDEQGKPLRSLGTVQDITERKQAELALRRSQKMDAIGQLSGGIAHDFNNILGIIIGNLSFLRRLVAGDEKSLMRVNNAHKAALRAADLTKQLLGFSRKQAEKMLPTNINQVIQHMDSLISRSITPLVEVEHHLANDLWLTETDSSDFEDALLNMILNARDAMPEGGRLTIETSNKVLDAAYAKRNPTVMPGEYVELAINDTGSGISKDDLDRIFEPFFTTKPQGKGTGLGMSMVFGFTRRSKGHVKVYSEPGIGTTIRCYLPRSHSVDKAERLTDAKEHPLPGGRETILVVDDEEDLLELAQQYLGELGYAIVTASSSQQALDILAEKPSINMLFSDVVMPGGMNGYELAEQVTTIYPGLRVLLTSGYSSRSLYRNGQARFKANLLTKPYNQDEMARRVRFVLDE